MKKINLSSVGFLLFLFLISCFSADGRSPKPPRARAASSNCYQSDWGLLPSGSEPPEFEEVRDKGYPWLYPGKWVITRFGYRVAEPLTDPEEPLTFRRYRGDAFGNKGLLPLRYRVLAKGRSLGGARRFNGYGEVAVQIFYLDPTHYVEVLQTDQHLRLWLADGAQPGSGEGWRLLAQFDNPTSIGQWISFGAEVDVVRRQVKVLHDGKTLDTLYVPFLRPIPHGLTLRATGNMEEWACLSIEKLR